MPYHALSNTEIFFYKFCISVAQGFHELNEFGFAQEAASALWCSD